MDNQLGKEEVVVEDNLNLSISFKNINYSLIKNKLLILVGIILGFSSAIYINLTTKEKLKHPCIGKRHELLDNGIYILKSLIEEIPIKEIIVTNKG